MQKCMFTTNFSEAIQKEFYKWEDIGFVFKVQIKLQKLCKSLNWRMQEKSQAKYETKVPKVQNGGRYKNIKADEKYCVQIWLHVASHERK